MTFNEYIPKGGLQAFNRRRRHRKLKGIALGALFLFLYAAASTALFYI